MGVVGGAAGGLAAGLGTARVATPADLLVVELQVFQTLRQGQFLLDGHAQQGVEGLLLILCCSQLPLHLVQLRDVLVTATRRRDQEKQKLSFLSMFALTNSGVNDTKTEKTETDKSAPPSS